MLAHVYAVRDAPTLDAARAAADRFVNTYGREYPAAVACFSDDLEALLAIHRYATASEYGPPTWYGLTG